MEVSKIDSQKFHENKEGEALVQQLSELTGLPKLVVNEELQHILENSGKSQENLTLEDLRHAMLVYLEHLAQTEFQQGLDS